MSAETEKNPTAIKGLKGVIAAESSISMVDGEAGRLVYRGYNVDDLAKHASFEEVAYLLLNTDLPTKDQLDVFKEQLQQDATLPTEVIDMLKSLPQDVQPMSALRTAVSLMGIYDPTAEELSAESNYEKAVRLTAALPTMVAAIKRLGEGNQPVAPRPGLGLAANFMYMLNDKVPTEDQSRAMDLILILHAEHGLNASTFTARVSCATLTDMYSAITGAIGALKGKLHGGANTEVLRTLMEIGSVENVKQWVEKTHAEKGKFMGFGHAVYKTADPRAKFLKEYSRRLGTELGEPKWYEMSEEMERLVVPLINRNCNVDFYSASLQHYMGIPYELFTCVFAASRVAGWCAHVLEQLADNKIIRPSSHYNGPEKRQFLPLEER